MIKVSWKSGPLVFLIQMECDESVVVEIAKDVTEYLEDNKEGITEQSDIIVMINEIARQCSEHYHVIVAEIDVLEYLKRCQFLNECTRRIFSSLSRKAFELKSFSDRVTFEIVFYTGDIIRKETSDSQIKLYIPILKKFLLKQAVLICENLSDARLYVDLTKEFLEERGENLYINVHLMHCGGSLMTDTVENEISYRECEPIACIVDSDRKYKDGPIGSTAKKAQRVVKRNENSYPIDLYILNVRMKENLFSPHLLLLDGAIANREVLERLKTKIDCPEYENVFRFFNFKEGIKYKNCEKNMMFKEQLEGIGYTWPTEEDIKASPEKIMVEGMGTDGLKTFHQEIINHRIDDRYREAEKRRCKEEHKRVIKEKVDRARKVLEYADPYWRDDWQRIEQIVVNFGMAFPETMHFAG